MIFPELAMQQFWLKLNCPECENNYHRDLRCYRHLGVWKLYSGLEWHYIPWMDCI